MAPHSEGIALINAVNKVHTLAHSVTLDYSNAHDFEIPSGLREMRYQAQEVDGANVTAQ